MFSDEMKSGGSQFVKLEDGQSITGVFQGDPLEYKKNFKLKTEYPMGLPVYPEGTTNSFKINFIVLKDGKCQPHVFNGSGKASVALEKVVSKYGMDYVYEISRNGSGTKTTYTFLPERSLTPEEKTEVKAQTLIELKVRDSD